jgi:exodeoxyribonuclease VII large subunit
LSKELDRARESLSRSLRDRLERQTQTLARTRERLRLAPALAVERKRAALEAVAGKLRALSPQATLDRGYAVVRTDNGTLVRSPQEVSRGEAIDVRVADGRFGARVE